MSRKGATDDEPIVGGMHICRPAPIHLESSGRNGLRLMSDLHIGAAHVDYKLIQRELDEALANADRISINGDLLDLILPKDAKRYQPNAVHPRVAKRNDQVNAVIEWTVEILEPVAHLIDMIGVGNHETSVQKWNSVDPTLLILYELEKIARQKDPNHVIHYGGYTGFIDYRVRTPHAKKGGHRFVIYYHHGSGGAAPVTRGIIDFNRRDVFVDADLLWLGHKHSRLAVTVEKLRCPEIGHEVDVREVNHVMTGAYFSTYAGQSQESVRKHGRRSNYAADMGLQPGGKGGVRIEFQLSRASSSQRPKVRVIQ